MKVARDPEFASLIKGKIAAFIRDGKRKPDGKFHVSDLLNPRYAYFAQKHDYSASEDEIGFFVSGMALHEFLQKILGAEMSEKQLALEDIVGTADQVGVFFAEIKTSRKWSIPEDPEPHYLEQFEKYLAMAKRTFGHIVVIYFVAGRTWDGKKPSTLEIVAWKVTISKQESLNAITELKERRDALKLVQEGRTSHESLPNCWQFKCGSVYKGQLSKLCPFYHECKPEDLYPERVFLKNARK